MPAFLNCCIWCIHSFSIQQRSADRCVSLQSDLVNSLAFENSTLRDRLEETEAEVQRAHKQINELVHERNALQKANKPVNSGLLSKSGTGIAASYDSLPEGGTPVAPRCVLHTVWFKSTLLVACRVTVRFTCCMSQVMLYIANHSTTPASRLFSSQHTGSCITVQFACCVSQ